MGESLNQIRYIFYVLLSCLLSVEKIKDDTIFGSE